MSSFTSSAVSALDLAGVALAALLVALFVVLLRNRGESSSDEAFQPRMQRHRPMSPAELVFFERLSAALPEVVVAPHVSMSALVERAHSQYPGSLEHFKHSKFDSQNLGFVLFDKHTGDVRHVIDLYDASHDTPSYRAMVEERDKVLQSAGYKVVRLDAEHPLTQDELRTLFA